MANYILTTSPQEVGINTSSTIGARLLAWYTDAGTSSAVVHLKLQAISQGTTYVGTNKDYELTLDSTATGTIAWPDTLPQDTWVDVTEITQSVAYGRTVSVYGKVWSYVYGDVSITGNTVTLNSPYTAPTTPTISAVADSATQISITYGTTSFGNPSTGTVYLYGGTSAAPTTQVTSKTTTGDSTYAYTGLTPNTTYYFRARANNGQLDSDYSTEVSVTLPKDIGFYGSVNGVAEKATKMYGSVMKITTKYSVTNLSGIRNFNSISFNNSYRAQFGDMLKAPADLLMNGNTTSGSFVLRFTDNSSVTLTAWSSNQQYQIVAPLWGISDGWSTPSPWSATYSTITSVTRVSKKISKFYGSQNGLSTLIFSD